MAHDIVRHLERSLHESTNKELLYLLGGVALVAIGTGLILSNPHIRKALARSGVGDFVSTALPDIERYIRSM